ncbi:MAG TPA: response regulator [Planctomycetota bacterium]|nr:response regulator [Planctomycetota bacterium]
MVASPTREASRLGRGRLLIAEQEDDLREELDSLFCTEGYETHVAADDDEAVEIVRHETIDVVILSLELPRGGGLGLLRVIRGVAGPRVPCVLTAAEVSGRLQVDALLEDVFTVVPKPPDDSLLKRVVELALRRFRVF